MKSWGTDLLADPNMFGFMVVIRLPDGILPPDESIPTKQSGTICYTDEHAEKIQDNLHYAFKVEV